MNRRTNIINMVLSTALTLVALVAVVLVCNSAYSHASMGEVLSLLIVGAIVSGFVITLLHELSHVLSGKKNRFAFISMTVWFFKWIKSGDKIKFGFTMLGNEAGYTETVPTDNENLAKRLSRVTKTPLATTFVLMLLGIIPLFFATDMPLWAFSLTAMFLPIGAYSFFGNALPAVNEGVRNDGALCKGLKIQDDESKVTLALLSVQCELYNGKTPGEINESSYFDVPQLPEDSLNFIMLLSARLSYYLDKSDFENAKKVKDRLLTLTEYMPKYVVKEIKTEALYAACTYDKNTEEADDLTYELEKFLNAVNTSSTIRAKIAYKLYVKGEKEGLDDFYNRGIREANRCPVKGLALYEKKLLSTMKDDILAD